MLMLKKLDWCAYWTIASMDSPQRGVSETNKFTNTMEAASILDAFEVVFKESSERLNKQGITDIDEGIATTILKPAYQALRHGLAFDWVVNSCVAILLEYYPFSPHLEFSGTKVFIEQFKDDPVFIKELENVHSQIYTVLQWVFEGYPDLAVYKRLSAYSGSTVLSEAYEYTLRFPPKEPFEIPFLTSSRIVYAVLLMDMLSLCVGNFKRVLWTDRINAVKESAPGHEDMVLVVGGKFNAFVFGDIDGSGVATWKRLIDGIKVFGLNTRVDRKDIVRVIPDEMTFFWFSDTTLFIDESKVPDVQIGESTSWINPREFPDVTGLVLDTPLRLKIKYDFPQDPDKPKTISLKGTTNTVIKDRLVVLDKDGIGETQIMFRGDVVGFKVADPEKKYPFTFFTSKKIEQSDNFGWL